MPILRPSPGSPPPWRERGNTSRRTCLLRRGHGWRHMHGVLPFKSVASDTPAATMLSAEMLALQLCLTKTSNSALPKSGQIQISGKTGNHRTHANVENIIQNRDAYFGSHAHHRLLQGNQEGALSCRGRQLF